MGSEETPEGEKAGRSLGFIAAHTFILGRMVGLGYSRQLMWWTQHTQRKTRVNTHVEREEPRTRRGIVSCRSVRRRIAFLSLSRWDFGGNKNSLVLGAHKMIVGVTQFQLYTSDIRTGEVPAQLRKRLWLKTGSGWGNM